MVAYDYLLTNSTSVALRMHAGEIKLKLELDGRSWSEAQKFAKSERDMCHHMDQRAHQSKETDITKA